VEFCELSQPPFGLLKAIPLHEDVFGWVFQDV
jgi:hypothetical protein